MKYIKQFGIILFISFIGEILHKLIPLPIPASIYGIVLLFILLETKIVPLASIKETGTFLIETMPIMFIPAAVGLLDSYTALGSSWLEYLIITVVSTFVVMIVSGRVTQTVLKHSDKKRSNNNG